MITDKLSNSKANPSIRSTGMSPPKWDGQFNNFYSWRLQFELYLKSATIDKDEDQLMFLLHKPVLPPRVTSSIQSCTTMIGPNGVWDRLEEKIPKSAVIKEIISEMEAIRPIRQKTAALETRAVLDRLSDFARRITEVGKETELYSPTVVRIVSSKLEPELYYEFERWMRRDHPTEKLSVTRIVEFLRAETEARERIAPTMFKPEAKWRTPSLNHFTGAGPSTTVRHQTRTANMVYSDPCMLGCGVHHKFVDCPVFQRQQPWQRRETMKTARRCYTCFCRHKSNECKKTKQCSDCGGRHNRMLNCIGTNPPVRGTSMNAPSIEHLFSTSQMNPESTSFIEDRLQ